VLHDVLRNAYVPWSFVICAAASISTPKVQLCLFRMPRRYLICYLYRVGFQVEPVCRFQRRLTLKRYSSHYARTAADIKQTLACAKLSPLDQESGARSENCLHQPLFKGKLLSQHIGHDTPRELLPP
jgi:hypothetical protein